MKGFFRAGNSHRGFAWTGLFLAASLLFLSSCARQILPGGEPEGIRAASWNMRWFPSGYPLENPEKRNSAREEERIAAAARFIAGEDVDLLMIQEMRSREICAVLVTNECLAGWKVNVCSDFPASPGSGVPPHQNAIISRFDALDSGFEPWKEQDGIKPPRGIAWAVYDLPGGVTAFLTVHLKSNYIPDGDPDPALAPARNRKMREISSAQLVEFAKMTISKKYNGKKVSAVIIGGDFNSSLYGSAPDGEKTLSILLDAGFRDCLARVPSRETISGSKNYPPAAFDYIFSLGRRKCQAPVISQKTRISDHKMVSVLVR